MPTRAGAGDISEGDARWGRAAGAWPPVPPWAPLAWWAVSAVVLIAVVVGVVGGPGPLDDPSQGDQRPGFLVDPDDARVVRGLALPGAPVGRRPVFLAFDRRVPAADDLSDALRSVATGVSTVLVVPRINARVAPSALPVVADPKGRIARAVGMDRPRDGGAPVGYAVLDSKGRVRYATIDPTWHRHAFELGLITGAVR
jgi:hypothetical protein